MLYDKMLSYLMLIYFDINVYLPCVFNIGFTITHLGCEASIRLKISSKIVKSYALAEQTLVCISS